ncbi:hypothetical protein JKF63_06663 [Porcisia hertigi]|uniref:Uncharacterized protein n=1 Tax=Porcisia hertigi TaxID=2761500 RepID=A0A836IZC2_9TRYP|nr:hypothetical protein JKF63_06663 [Porcisia hertigi]
MISRPAAFAEYVTVESIRKINRLVKPSYIQTLADELGNPLHVILCYEIERDLINGRLEAVDVPRAWSEKVRAHVGLETLGRGDIGRLQDIHWARGNWVIFFAYSIGAAQLMEAIRQKLGDGVVTQCIRTGNIEFILTMQKEMIWDIGCFLETDELCIRATDESP